MSNAALINRLRNGPAPVRDPDLNDNAADALAAADAREKEKDAEITNLIASAGCYSHTLRNASDAFVLSGREEIAQHCDQAADALADARAEAEALRLEAVRLTQEWGLSLTRYEAAIGRVRAMGRAG